MKNHLFRLLFCVLTLGAFQSVQAADFSVSGLSIFNVNNSLNNQLYEGIGLEEYGLTRDALDYAVAGYESLVANGVVENQQYLTVIDFSQPIFSKRFYLIDVENRELVLNTYVMHGKKTGAEMAEKFSNKMNSNQSSLGFYVTKHPYSGSRGYSLRLAGLEKKFNSNAEKRGIVLHGSKYINEERALNRNVERSLGCPAIPQQENKDVINRIKEGSLIFIYYPSGEYLEESPILNGAY